MLLLSCLIISAVSAVSFSLTGNTTVTTVLDDDYEVANNFTNVTEVSIVPRVGHHDDSTEDQIGIEAIIVASLTGCVALVAIVIGAVSYLQKQRQRVRGTPVVKYLNSKSRDGSGTPPTPSIGVKPSPPDAYEKTKFANEPLNA